MTCQNSNCRNPKHQAPNPIKTPNSKSQEKVAGSLWSLGFGGFLGFGIWCLGFATAIAAEPTLTYIDLVHRLTDLQYLATLPSPGERCAQWSSYDRASR